MVYLGAEHVRASVGVFIHECVLVDPGSCFAGGRRLCMHVHIQSKSLVPKVCPAFQGSPARLFMVLSAPAPLGPLPLSYKP